MCIWDATTGASIRSITGHTFYVTTVAYSPDGTKIASGSANTVHIWDAATGTSMKTLTGHTGTVWSVAFSPDSSRIVSGSDDNPVRIWTVLCPPGQYSDSANQCTLCPPGFYSITFGATSNATCNACPENSFSFVEGAPSPSTCLVCPDGAYSFSAASFCNAPPTILSCPANPILLLQGPSFLLPSSLVNSVWTDDRGNAMQRGKDLLNFPHAPGIHNVSLLVTDSDGSSNLVLSTGVENPRKQECPFQVLALPLTSNFSTPSPRFSIPQGTLFEVPVLETSFIPKNRLLIFVDNGNLPRGIALG